MAKQAVRDLTGRACIVVPKINVSDKHWHRRGIITRSAYRFGETQHLVNLESRGFENERRTVWIPQMALIARSPKNEKMLAHKLRGNDDAKIEDKENVQHQA